MASVIDNNNNILTKKFTNIIKENQSTFDFVLGQKKFTELKDKILPPEEVSNNIKEKQEKFTELKDKILTYNEENNVTTKTIKKEDYDIDITKAVKPKNATELNKQLDFNLTQCKCESISNIIKAGADFLQNFFEVAFVFRDQTIQDNSFERLLYTRIGSISIPRLKAKTFTVKTIGGGVEKVASRLEGSYDINLTIRLDQNCIVLDDFSKMFGDYEGKTIEPKIYPASSIFNSNDIGFGKNKRIDILVKDISGFEHRTFEDNSNKFKSFNKLLLENVKTKSWVKVNTPNVYLNSSLYSEWVLEDVRIVDISDQEWSFDTTSPIEVTLQLIAKSVYHREADFV